MQLSLAYGNGTLDVEVDLPSGVRVDVLEKASVPPLADPDDAIRRALEAPIGTPPLAALARGRRSAVIVVSDATRPVPNAWLLPPILETLEQAGLARENVSILVATGLHRPATPEELDEILGADLARSLHILQHDARDRDAHVELATSAHGIPAWIDRRYLEADLKILTGLIEPHLMAGYSGGRKAVCPGLAAVETIRVAHGPRILEGHVGAGILEGNPLHQDLTAIARAAGADFIANVVIDRARRVAGVFCGDLERAFEAGATFAEDESRVEVDAPADLVLVSGGGAPLDRTFYQAIKGIAAAAAIVKPGGTILLVAKLSEGIGSPSFEKLLRGCPSARDFELRLEDPEFFAIDQWMIQCLCQARRRAHVGLHTDGVPPDTIREMLVEPAMDLSREILDRLGSGGERIAVIPQGPYVLATLGGSGTRPLGRGAPLDAP